MKKLPIYSNEASETAFRAWQIKHNACLITNWTVANPPLSFDRFSLARYTGRLNFDLW